MKRLEALCDAIAYANHYMEPESEAYEIRNPGMLACIVHKKHATFSCHRERDDGSEIKQRHEHRPDGKRIYRCHRAGYAALCDKAEKYCAANPTTEISRLLEAFGIQMSIQQEQTLDFMARCANSTLTLKTPLQWFIAHE